MPRRRIYVFDLAAILSDAPPQPRRYRQSLVFAALTGVLAALAIVLVRLIVELTPSHRVEAALAFAVAYLFVVLLFVAIAIRVHHWKL
jgi:uncharacterized membrane protein YqjE